VFRKIKAVIQNQLTQGTSRTECGKAIACALTVGVFPIMGCSTPINTLLAAVFRLNQPLVQSFNWIAGPAKIALIFPFLRLGEWLFRAEPFTLSLNEFSQRFFSDMATTSQEFAWTFIHAIVGWLVCVPFIYLAVFFLTKPFLSRKLMTPAHGETK